jgi:hypothetical protein
MILATIRTRLLSISILFVCTLILPSCLSSRKIDKWVDKKYSETLSTPTKKNHDYLAVTTTLPTADEKSSNTLRTHNSLLPLLFYWRWHITNTCTLNPKIPYNNFTNTALSYASSKGLKSKLNGRRVELEVKQMPNAFAIDDVSQMVWVVYAFGWDNFSVIPVNNNMVVSYKIMQENAEVKTGVITIPDPSKPIQVTMFQSLKKKAGMYIDQYNDNITAMSKKVVDSLITSL